MHTPNFPISLATMIIWALVLSVVSLAFIALMVRFMRRGKRAAVLSVFTLLFLAGTAMHVILLSRSHHTVTDGNWIQLSAVSALASLEMFIAQTAVFDDIIAAVIFGEPMLLLAYVSIFVLDILFTVSLFFLIVPRGFKDKLLLGLRERRGSTNRLHVFLGDSHWARMLAQSIRESAPKEDILFVDFPSPDEKSEGELSIGEVLQAMFSRKEERLLGDILGYSHFFFIRGRFPSLSSGTSLAQAIGIKALDKSLARKRTHVYILTEDENYNFRFLQLLSGQANLQAKVYCYNEDINNYTALYANVGSRIRLLNRQELIFTQIKRQDASLMPVQVASLARDADGSCLGYAREEFTAMLVGFGATGQEALRFIHEFASFVGKDGRPFTNNYHVFDPEIEHLKGEFLSRTPAFRYDSNLVWHTESTGSERFWLEYAMMLPSLNYVVVSVDGGHRNVEIAVRLLQDAARFGKDLSRMKILVKATEEDPQLPDMVHFYNRSFCPEGVRVIEPFGIGKKIWNLDVVTGQSLKAQAVRFREVAAREGHLDPVSWESRSERIRSSGETPLAIHRELHRRQAMDIDTCLFSHTLYTLSGGKIPALDDPMMEVLAASFQQFWVNALSVQGYILGPTSDELNRRLPGLLPYLDLSAEDQAYVRNAARISLLYEQSKNL